MNLARLFKASLVPCVAVGLATLSAIPAYAVSGSGSSLGLPSASPRLAKVSPLAIVVTFGVPLLLLLALVIVPRARRRLHGFFRSRAFRSELGHIETLVEHWSTALPHHVGPQRHGTSQDVTTEPGNGVGQRRREERS